MRAFQQNPAPTGGESRSPESDSTPVHLAKQDVRWFAPLCERYRDDFLRYCAHYLGNWEEAADATQQTFANALAALSRFQDTNNSFRGWLFRIAHNEVVSRHRQQTRRAEHPLAEEDWVADAGRSPEELAIPADDHTRVYALLLSLAPQQRRCCELRFSSLTYGETAAILGKSEVAVRASFSRGLAALRGLLEDNGNST